MLIKNVFIVYSDYSLFIKTIQRKNKKSQIIDPFIIKKRYSTEDIECPDEIVNYNIIKRINAFTNCKLSSFIYFYANELNVDIISELDNLFRFCEYTLYFHLLCEKDLIDDIPIEVKDKFHSIQFIK